MAKKNNKGGRPKRGNSPRVTFSISLSEEELETINRLALAFEISKAEFIRTCINKFMSDFKPTNIKYQDYLNKKGA